MSLLKEINEIPRTKKELKKFGLTLGIFFLLLAAYFGWHGRTYAVYFWGAGSFFLFFGFALPAFLRPLQKVWMTLALLMGWVMSHVLLILLFLLVVTPLGLFLRLSGKDLLGIKSARRDTYWIPRKSRPKQDYENQF